MKPNSAEDFAAGTSLKSPDEHPLSGNGQSALNVFSTNRSLEPVTEQLEEPLHLTRTLTAESPCDHLRLVAVSMDGEIRMLPVSGDPVYRVELYQVLTANLTPLGLLGFVESEGQIQAQSYLFPWHEDNPSLAGLFERICDQAVESVQSGFERRGRVH